MGTSGRRRLDGDVCTGPSGRDPPSGVCACPPARSPLCCSSFWARVGRGRLPPAGGPWAGPARLLRGGSPGRGVPRWGGTVHGKRQGHWEAAFQCQGARSRWDPPRQVAPVRPSVELEPNSDLRRCLTRPLFSGLFWTNGALKSPSSRTRVHAGANWQRSHIPRSHLGSVSPACGRVPLDSLRWGGLIGGVPRGDL